jgi:glycosyltransferase involved in cell wall biosynthesis
MNNPLVSILIPAYNREILIKDAIESALNQTYKNIEIIIIDNNSKDNTWQVIMYYESIDPRIIAYRNKENIGPVLNWQKCISVSSGEYIKFLFSDDFISENYIQEGIELFDNNTSFVLSPVKIINNLNMEIIQYSDYNKNSVLSKKKYLRNILFFNRLKLPVSPGAGIFRKSDIQKTLEIDLSNPFNLNFNKFGAGPDLLLYLNSVDKNIIKISTNSIAYFRSHESSFTIANNLIFDYEFVKAYFVLKRSKLYKILYFFIILFKSSYTKEIRKLVQFVFKKIF